MKSDFAAAFREQMQGFLHRHGGLRPGERSRTVNLGTRRLLIVDSLATPPNYALADVLVVLGDLQAGPGSWFAGPVLVGGACVIGKGSRLMALAAGRQLVLGEGSEVSDWVDCNGPVVLGGGSRIRGGAASRHSVQMGQGVEAFGLFAPAIATPDFAARTRGPDSNAQPVEILPPGKKQEAAWSRNTGVQRARLSAIGEDTWIYDGTLRFESPVILKSKIVTRGSFLCTKSSLLEGNVKAGGDVSIGADSIVNGELTARGDLHLGANCLFTGDLSAGVTMRISTGTRGYREGSPVQASAGTSIEIESNVLIRGELRSGAGVRHRGNVPSRDQELMLANA